MKNGAANTICRTLGQITQPMLKAAVREVGWRAAQSLLQALFTEVPSFAGVLDPEEVAALGQLEVWLKAWGRNPRHPAK